MINGPNFELAASGRNLDLAKQIVDLLIRETRSMVEVNQVLSLVGMVAENALVLIEEKNKGG